MISYLKRNEFLLVDKSSQDLTHDASFVLIMVIIMMTCLYDSLSIRMTPKTVM